MSYQKEFKKLYNPQLIHQNLNEVFKMCSIEDLENGKGWYENANLFCSSLASKYGISTIQSTGIVAAMSAQKSWKMNQHIAEVFISSEGNTTYHTSVQVNKSKLILESNPTKEDVERILGGYKTINFFNNMLNPDAKEYVTIDRHHLYIVSGVDLQICTKKQYDFIKHNTIIFADEVNLLPNQVQSILWTCWKRIKRKVLWERKQKFLKK